MLITPVSESAAGTTKMAANKIDSHLFRFSLFFNLIPKTS